MRLFTVFLAGMLAPAANPRPEVAALQPFNPLVGSWKGTGYPEGSRDERAKGFWTETVAWEWKFDATGGRLVAAFDKGKHLASAELRFLPDRKVYQLTATAPDKSVAVYTGPLTAGKAKEQILTLERAADGSKETHRFVLTLLHHNRMLYRFETRPAGVTAFTKRYQVGATKEGEPFAQLPQGPECVVSGGEAKTPVTHKGKTYYVCCSGCKAAFQDDPDKYVAEYEKKQAAKKK